MGLKTDHSATLYSTSKEFFPGGKSKAITIFGDLRKKEKVYEINPPKKGPFIVTTLEPRAFTQQAIEKALKAKGRAKVLMVGAAVLGIGAYAVQKKMENNKLERLKIQKEDYLKRHSKNS